MPAEIYQEALDVVCDVLEALEPQVGRARPHLRRAGRQEIVRLPTVVLENAFVQAVFAPSLGGRLISLLDKRTGVEAIPKPNALAVVGDETLLIESGIEWLPVGFDRQDNLGWVHHEEVEADDPDDPVVLRLWSAAVGRPFVWWAEVSLNPEAACLEVALWNQNRGDCAVLGTSGIRPSLRNALWHIGEDHAVASQPERKAGLHFMFEPGTFDSFCGTEEGFSLLRRSKTAPPLSPRQVDAVRCQIAPVTEVEGLAAVSHRGVLGLADGRLNLQTTEPVEGTVYLLLRSGQTVEAPLRTGSAPWAAELQGEMRDPARITVHDKQGEEVVGWVADIEAQPSITRTADEPDWGAIVQDGPAIERGMHPSSLALAGRDAALAPQSLWRQAQNRFEASEFGQGLDLLERALNLNAEDPLAWWLHATASRVANRIGDGERADLLNAHTVCPLEPALRAEAFLSQPQTHGKEPSPVVSPIGDDPHALIDVACLLLDAGFAQEAARWIDEALRHRDEPILHWLLAAALLEGSRMEVEASHHVAQAARKPFGPPYPWRPAERRAIELLSMKFPQDARLKAALASQ